ncbi:hypothetical protein PG993_003990 [Apiospora rasikravindrae]|uniref:Uncharacterized protein n=1 Tax=Apiospora rasikravindrae TaxID=990691 RepID=A0ABR1U130_9PEZI
MAAKRCQRPHCKEDADADERYCYIHLCVGTDDSWCGRRKSSDADQCPDCTCTYVFQPGKDFFNDNHTVGDQCKYLADGEVQGRRVATG